MPGLSRGGGLGGAEVEGLAGADSVVA